MTKNIKEARVPMLSLQMVFSALAMTGVGLVTPRLAEAFSLGASQAGLLVSAQFAGAAAGCLLSGVLCKKFGTSFITRVCLAITAPALLIFGYCANFPMALAGAFLIGSAIIAMENSIMSSGMAIEGKGAFINALLQTSFSVGAILLPLLFWLLLAWDVWRPVYLFLAAGSVVMLLVSRGRPESGAPVSIAKTLTVYGAYITKPSFVLGAVVLFLYQASEVGLWSLAPTLFEATGGGRTSGIISSALIWTMMLFGRVFSTMLMRRYPMMKILTPFGILGLLALTALLFTQGTAAIICTALAGLAFAPFYAFLTSWATEVAGDSSSAYLAFVMVVGSMGPVFLGLIVGLFGGALGGGLIVLPSLGCFVVMMGLLAVFGRRGATK